jgi:IstB-like ATP binding protein
LFEIILRRHEIKSTMMTSNRPLQDWGKLIGDVPAATAILDRFLEHAELIQITGQSYRLRNRTKEKMDQEEKTQQDTKTDQEKKTIPGPKTGQSAHRVEPEKSPEKNCPKNNQANRSKDQKTPPEA